MGPLVLFFSTAYASEGSPGGSFVKNPPANAGDVSAGRLREDHVYDYKFIGLSHNTLRGAAGGAVLIAELLYKKGYFD